MDLQQKQILRLHHQGHSLRSISRQLGIDRRTVKVYVELYKASGQPLGDLLASDTDITSVLVGEPPPKKTDQRYDEAKRFVENRKGLRRQPGFTIDNLYGDYLKMATSPYSRAQFYRLVGQLWSKERGSIKLNHKYGEKLYVDYTGKKLSYVDKATGEIIYTEVLVTILPASQYIYVEAMPSQKRGRFCARHNKRYGIHRR